MIKDIFGYELSGATAEAIGAYENAVQAMNLFKGDPVALVDQSIEHAPQFAMVHLFKAFLYATATEPAATTAALQMAENIRALDLNNRETALLAALDQVLAGNWTKAALLLDHYSMDNPVDIVALQMGHLIDFFRGNARDLRDRIARTLPAWSEDIPGYSTVLGLYSFGLEEAGEYAKAEDMGREAIEREPRDSWAHHAVTHVMEMQGRASDGIEWMNSREEHWASEDDFFQVHNWWHKAVFHLDLDQADEALLLYDGPIRSDRSDVAVDLVDASALLWRLMALGHDVGERWIELADAWDTHADGKLYPFNDWHGAMAYLGADRVDRVEQILEGYRSNRPAANEVDVWSRTTGKALIEGFAAFRRGDYQGTVEQLHDARYIVNTFGGSHAQRDVIDWTLTEAAIRSGSTSVAQALIGERLAQKPHSPVNLGFLARVTT